MNFDDIRLLDDSADLSKIMPFDWDLMIGDTPYYVCTIPGYCHSVCFSGGLESRGNLWCYPRDQKPSLDNLKEYSLKEPVAWGIEYRIRNKIVTKWGESETRAAGAAVITRNGEDFYEVCGALSNSLNQALYLLTKVKDHPLEFSSIDYDKKMVGRKIWYNGEPGKITYYVKGQCCVIIEPDGIERFSVPNEFKNDDILDWDERDLKIDCLKSGRIWWFRD